MVTIETLRQGGSGWRERLEDALKRADMTWHSYTKDKGSATRTLISKRLLMPLYVDYSQPYGEKWRQLFQFLGNTEEHQTVLIVRNQFFPNMDDLSLPKRWYLLPAKRWGYGKENISVREALEAKLQGFTLESVREIDDVPIGLDFAGVSANSHIKVATPYNWLRGRKMYEALGNQLKMSYSAEGKQFTIRLQMGREDLSQAFDVGIRIVAENAPSLSGEEAPHKVTIINVPVYMVSEGITERTKRRGYDIFTSDDCMRNVFSDDKFTRKIKSAFGREERTGSENEFDHHSILVIDAASDLISQHYPGLAIDNPIPQVPGGVEELVDLAFKRIRVIVPGARNDGQMLWEANALMQIYTMMGIANLNSLRQREQNLPRDAA